MCLRTHVRRCVRAGRPIGERAPTACAGLKAMIMSLTRAGSGGVPFGGWCRAKIWVMEPAGGPDVVAGRVAHPGAGGVVSRTGLFGRLGAARVTVVSAPPGSGKSVLLRSWIGEAGLAESAGWVSVGRDDRDP